jgi:hypothetical protein
LAIICFTGVDQSRDVRMIETRKDLPLSAETHAEIGSLRAVDDFDSNLS